MPLSKTGGGTELQGDLALLWIGLLVELGIAGKVGPGLGGLGGTQDAGNGQVGSSEMPRMGWIEVEPEGGEMAKQTVIQEGNPPPTGGTRRDGLAVLPLEAIASRRLEGAESKGFVGFLFMQPITEGTIDGANNF